MCVPADSDARPADASGDKDSQLGRAYCEVERWVDAEVELGGTRYDAQLAFLDEGLGN